MSDILHVPTENVYAWRFKVFVASKVSEILELTLLKVWYHIASKDNPADFATWGLYPS